MEAYEYIKKNAIAYAVEYSDEAVIDKINIRQATLLTMRNAINKLNPPPELLLVDGNDFKPYIRFHNGVFHQTHTLSFCKPWQSRTRIVRKVFSNPLPKQA